MARKPVRARAEARGERQNRGQAAWLRGKVEAEHPGFNPVLEMIRLYKKPKLTRRDRERFDQLQQIAQYLQPKLKAVELELGGPEGGEGELVVKWKGR